MLLKQTIFSFLPDDPPPITDGELVTLANQREDEATPLNSLYQSREDVVL